MSCSGKTTWWAPTRSRIRPCLLLMALAQMSWHAELGQREHGQDAGFDVGADADDGAVELGDAELAQRLASVVSACDDVGQLSAQLLHELGFSSMPRTSWPMLDQRVGDGAAEPAEADDDDASWSRIAGLSQRWVAPPEVGSGGGRLTQRQRGGDGDRADPADEHQHDQDELAAGGRSAVMPVDSPTVANAEIVSNSTWSRA